MNQDTSTVPQGANSDLEIETNKPIPAEGDLSAVKFDTPPEYRTHDGDEFITLKQAHSLLGVSERSLQRYTTELRSSSDPKLRNAVRTENRDNGGIRRRISRRFVTQRFLHLTQVNPTLKGAPGVKSEEQNHNKEVMGLLKQVISNLERERDDKATEIAEKNKQIEQLHNLLKAKEIAMAKLQGVEILEDGSVRKVGLLKRLFGGKK